jgi:hypothetical protein
MEKQITLEFSVAKLQIKTNLEWDRYSERNTEEYMISEENLQAISF